MTIRKIKKELRKQIPNITFHRGIGEINKNEWYCHINSNTYYNIFNLARLYINKEFPRRLNIVYD